MGGTATIPVTYGATPAVDVECVGMTIAQVRDSLAEGLNIPEDADAAVSGEPVEASYKLQTGDSLEFVRASGEKGTAD